MSSKGIWILTEQTDRAISILVFKTKRQVTMYLRELVGWTSGDVEEAMNGNQVYGSHVRFTELGEETEIPRID